MIIFPFYDVTQMMIIHKQFKPHLAIKMLWSWKLIPPPPTIPNTILCFFFGGKLLQIVDSFGGKFWKIMKIQGKILEGSILLKVIK
jgi:hypothetical protein